MWMLNLSRTPDEAAAVIDATLDDYFGIHPRWRVDVCDSVATISGEFRDGAERSIVAVLAGLTPGIERVEVNLVNG